MNLIEALTLAKEQGKKVRPKCWDDWKSPCPWLEYRFPQGGRPVLVRVWPEDEDAYTPRLDDDRELLGEWEVVDG